MILHKTEFGWTTPCIVTERGTYSNHHYTEDGLIGERVTPDSATHFIVVEATVSDPANKRGVVNILSTEIIEK
jgi:hypothetical protein